MSYAYTPGLKIKRSTILRKRRILPVSGEILVKEGDYVSANMIVARTFVPGGVITRPVSFILGVEPYELPSVMLKKEGDAVKAGEIIAQSSSFFGLFKSRYVCETTGTIELISDVTGMVAFRELPTPVNINAYISGKVVETIPRISVVIESTAAVVQGILGIGGERQGELMTVAAPDEVLTTDHIGNDCAGKILVGGSLVTSEVLKKAADTHVSGIVVGGMRRCELTKFLGYEIGVAITGHENMPLTCIITEGFGKMNMAKHTFDLLKCLEGKKASMNGATQIRAGVIRPEVIVPMEDAKNAASNEEKESFEEGMNIGTRVRIIRRPHFGSIGKVMDLPIDLQLLETGSKVRVAVIELEGGERVVVPRANLEIMEE